MIRLKTKEELSLDAIMLCNVVSCNEEATDLFTTETNIVDVCSYHKQFLLSQSFIS